jgi:glycosyltransferase involved in cell wall biosynthesis
VHTLHDYYLLCPRVTLHDRDGKPCRRGRFCRYRTHRLRHWSGAVDAVVGVSNTLLDRHDRFFPQAKQHLIRHPQPAQHALAPPASPPRTIGYLGALEVVKGVHVLLDAAPRLVELGFALRVAGDGSLRSAVEAAASQLPGVSYAGRVTTEARESFIAGCDVGLVPSIWAEPGGPPLVLLEWLAAGRPVVSSGRGGLAELEGARGVVEVAPTPNTLVETLAGLRQDGMWDGLRATVRPPTLPSPDDWLDRYEAVLLGREG